MRHTIATVQDRGGRWRWRVTAPNGQITAVSGEAFASSSNATRAWRAHLRALHADPRLPFDLPEMRISLDAATADRLRKPVRGQGGFQSLLRRLQGQLHGRLLTVTAADYEKLVRYSTAYGGGGWQGRRP